MALTPNIDECGKTHRVRGGVAVLASGALLLLGWAIPVGGTLAWVASLGLMAVGAFMIFEGKSGWCIARALGFRTKI